MTLLHLADRDDWAAARARGTYDVSTRGATIAEVGYLHACHDEAQLAGVVRRFYADVDPASLVVLHLDADALAAAGLEVRDEPADPNDPASERFPHVYGGPLPVGVVSRSTPAVA